MTTHAHRPASRNLVLSIAINIIIVIVEIVFGLLSQSFALISDALHNLTDIGSMIMSLWGLRLADKPRTEKKTYGYKRAEALIAFVNGAVLLGVVGFILLEALIRLFNPEPVSGGTMMAVAGFALLGNGFATVLLGKEAGENLNLKSAWLHSLQDALFSLGVIVSAALIYMTGWDIIDPVASIVISLFLFRKIYGVLADTVYMALDSVPKDIDLAEVKKGLRALPGVMEVNDLHIWQIGSDDRLLSAHIMTDDFDSARHIKLIADARCLLAEKYGIDHVTLQTVSLKESKMIDLSCAHCN